MKGGYTREMPLTREPQELQRVIRLTFRLMYLFAFDCNIHRFQEIGKGRFGRRKVGLNYVDTFWEGKFLSLNAREPTGQTFTHSAHWPQVDSAIGLSWKVETIRLNPLLVKPMAPIPNFSWHTHTHLPHRTHLLGS